MKKLYINNIIFKIFKKNNTKPFSETNLKNILYKKKLNSKKKLEQVKRLNSLKKKKIIMKKNFNSLSCRTKSFSIKKKLFLSFKKKYKKNSINIEKNEVEVYNKVINIKKLMLMKKKINLESSINNYKIIRLINETNEYKIYKGIHILTNSFVAIKIINKKLNNEKIINDLKILASMKNIPYILNIYENFENEYYYYQIYQYQKCINLFDFLKKNETLPKIKLYEIIYKIFLIFKELSLKNIIHKNIKIENILIDEQLNPIIKNFKISIIENNKNSNNYSFGSPHYMSPELIKNKKFSSTKSDIWSLGVLVYYLIYKDYPFNSKNIKNLFFKILNDKLVFLNDNKGKEIKELLKNMLKKKIKERYSIHDCLNFKIFNNKNFIEIKNNFTKNIKNNKKLNFKIIKELTNLGFKYDKIKESVENNLLNFSDSCYNIYLNNN